jgi:hypothetical protein
MDRLCHLGTELRERLSSEDLRIITDLADMVAVAWYRLHGAIEKAAPSKEQLAVPSNEQLADRLVPEIDRVEAMSLTLKGIPVPSRLSPGRTDEEERQHSIGFERAEDIG